VAIEPAFVTEGVPELRARLKAVAGTDKDLRNAHRRVSKVVESSSRSRASAGTRQQARAASSLLGKGDARGAALAMRNTTRVPFGLGAFLGGKRPQFPPWVGARWDVLAGGGPYVIGEAIRADRAQIEQSFVDEILAVIAQAGLDTE
jgi:hypothetical protein